MSAEQAAHDAVEDARARLARHRAWWRLIAAWYVATVVGILGGSALCWIGAWPIGLPTILLSVPALITACVVASDGSPETTEKQPHPADQLRAAERRLRDTLTGGNA